ncbi:MAG: 23S rRNA (pseudouridine(1915)-N(3))-methyltransferase RlmH [Anaerolineae bacterium]
MYKVKILSIGKTREKWLQEAVAEYTKRLQNRLLIEWTLCKDDKSLLTETLKEKSLICLDPQGLVLNSNDFSQKLRQLFIDEHSRLTFVIGGAEGIPLQVKQRAVLLLSLSPLTFTHQLTRLILIEQLYRALEIAKGSSYHK